MITISRVTEASTVPVTIFIATNRVRRYLALPGPMSSVEIPGDILLDLQIANPELWGIRVVSDDIEYRLSEIGDFRSLRRVQAILIYDGFIVLPGGYPGFTVRPQHIVRNRLLETGESILYPGIPCPILPPPYPGPIPPCPGIVPGPIPPPGYPPYYPIYSNPVPNPYPVYGGANPGIGNGQLLQDNIEHGNDIGINGAENNQEQLDIDYNIHNTHGF